EELGLELATQPLFRHRREAAGVHLARVVPEDADRAESLARAARQALDVGGDGHVGDDREHLAAGLRDQLVARLLERGLGARADRHPRARLEQLLRDLASDAARAAGDDGAAAADTEVP